ncbi:hypothetical protein PQR34_48460 [Paraburkholderia sediminicola]|uniref:DUF6984 family protein n=1 Tax=Paraburkholderia sediminicola TaxID=458836 RepID=UPI0038BA4BEE
MGKIRLLKDEERKLLAALIAGTPRAPQLLASLPGCFVEEMNDGGMGSIRFCLRSDRPRRLGEQLAEREFADQDGVPVIIALNLDDRGELYELDVWKVDFSPLQRFPSVIK